MIEHLLEPGFGGVVGRTVAESTPWWPPRPTPPSGAPNVVVVVLDDVGFAQLGCYGSDISTPHIDRIADDGVRYTNFHVTPLCSPTRACLLTGRNHHSVGMGMISGFPSGFPSGRESVTNRAAMLPAVLGAAGYGTYAVGKWHLAPMSDMTPAGRFTHWPLAHGFDRFYGFLGGETDQYRPNLYIDNHVADPPERDDYHLSEDLVDQSIRMVADHVSSAPDRPFFLYLAFGAVHGPHQVPEPYRSRARGRYDGGWDVARERWHRRQLDLGVIPEGSGLAPRNPDVAAWNELSPADRTRMARFQEVFAGFLEHTDAQVGRLVEALDRLGCADETILVVLSDNGAAGEGGARGSWNELIPFNGLSDAEAKGLEGDQELGSDETYPLYPRGWAQVGNTPLKWYKHHTYGGGVRAPMIVRWPGRTGATGGFRRRFHHAIDLAPTILEAAGLSAPSEFGGVPQLPIHGQSMFDGLTGDDLSGSVRTQYFEMEGHRGIYHAGWKAVTMHRPGDPFEDDVWELFHLDDDFAELRDLSAEEPRRLGEMEQRWWHEAGRYGVTPLDDRFLERAQDRRGTDSEGRTRFVYHRGSARISESAAAEVRGAPFTITVELKDFRAGDEGVLVSFGGRYSGFVLYVLGDRACFDHNAYGEMTRLRASQPLPSGDAVVSLHARPVAGRLDVALHVPGGVDHVVVPRSVPYYSGGNGFEIGENRLSRVSDAYERPFEYTGRFDAVVIDAAPGGDDAGRASAAARAD